MYCSTDVVLLAQS